MDDLEGKIALITGGAGGIGMAMARRFVADGMRVMIGDVDDAAIGTAVAEFDGEVAGWTCDVTSQESMDDLRAATVERFGSVDVVCLNAGVAPIGLTLDTDLETWRWAFDVNVMGVVHGIRAFAPALVAHGAGHIVLTASTSGLATTYAMGTYSATKHAVVGIGTTLREELGSTGVGVSVLCPGPFRTRIFESERNRPTGRPGETYAVSDAVVASYKRAVAASPDPAIVADAVFEAIVANRLFVLPSPEVNASVIERLDLIRGALEPVPVTE